jgi:hypothetical protein
MKKETSRKLSLSKIKIANLSKTIETKDKQAPTTTVYFSYVVACKA